MLSFLKLVIFEPLYNGLILIMGVFPFFDAGVSIIVFTIIVKIILLPLSIKASRTQLEMKSTEKDMLLIKQKYPGREEQSRKIMEYYQEKGINPFAGIFILLIQLPILIGLYQVFIKSGLPEINTSLLYSFIPVPANIDMFFLNIINISERSVILAILVGISTYFQIHIASGQNKGGEAQGDLAKAMSIQMKYFFPFFMVFITYSISSAIALYFITSNLFAIGQEIYIKKKYHKNPPIVV